MKKYVVLKKIGIFNMEEDRQFESEVDAREYKKLCQLAEGNPRITYHVAKLID